MSAENTILRQLQEIVADAAMNTPKQQSMSTLDAATAEYAMRWLSVPAGQDLNKWSMLRIQIATLCHTFAQLGISDAAGLLKAILEDMERYEKFELEGRFGK